MNTGKALVAGLIVTIGLLALSYGAEGIAQLAGPEEIEEEHTFDQEQEHEEGEDDDGVVDIDDADADEDEDEDEEDH